MARHPRRSTHQHRLQGLSPALTIMKTAVEDELLEASPCRVRGAGQERAPEGPIATVDEVQLLREAMPDRIKIMVDMAVWCQMRREEIFGLQRGEFDIHDSAAHDVRSRTPPRRGHRQHSGVVSHRWSRRLTNFFNGLPAFVDHRCPDPIHWSRHCEGLFFASRMSMTRQKTTHFASVPGSHSHRIQFGRPREAPTMVVRP